YRRYLATPGGQRVSSVSAQRGAMAVHLGTDMDLRHRRRKRPAAPHRRHEPPPECALASRSRMRAYGHWQRFRDVPALVSFTDRVRRWTAALERQGALPACL